MSCHESGVSVVAGRQSHLGGVGCDSLSILHGNIAGELSDRLIGTWRVVRYVDTNASGAVTYPFGEKPSGYFVYDATGHLSIQIMRMPARPMFASGDDKKGTDAEVRTAYESYAAYFGTYRVDEAKGVVTHVVEGSLNPSYTGTEQPRPFKLDGDVLTIQLHAEEDAPRTFGSFIASSEKTGLDR